MHARLFPQKNAFSYGIYYLSIPLQKINNLPIAYNRFGLISFYDKDHGACDGSDLNLWIQSILNDYEIHDVYDITLLCMPRVLGYVFNPVSFWICRDKSYNIKAVLCEVHNTFDEKHNYLCSFEKGETVKAQKVFHVSPFLKREGHYEFTFDIGDENVKIDIDFYDAEGDKQLVTYLQGQLEAMDKKALRKAFCTYPLITFKAIALIHWQALKLVLKGIKYIPKPLQKDSKTTVTDNLTKI